MFLPFLASTPAYDDTPEEAPSSTTEGSDELSEGSESKPPKGCLQSEELETLLNMIDELRAQGIGRSIDLPQMIVCGDQSSGKSSVLEAISGVRFPSKTTLCTRFPTELILRRNATTSTVISIIPDAAREGEERERLETFEAGAEALADFGGLVEAAASAMGLDQSSRVFKHDVLRVELTGPTQPNLTLVDLPGFFHASSSTQSTDDSGAVRSLVTQYIRKPRSIILAVVAASNEYVNQIVTEFARAADPMGERTLGIITKPDRLDPGSESERQFFDLAENKDIVLRLGWHVLKNRDFTTRDSSAEERDRIEAEFFNRGIWAALAPSQKGIGALKARLSSMLEDLFITELPAFTSDIETGIKESKVKLNRLGAVRMNVLEQRMYLFQISQSFCKVMQDAVAGHYDDQYFNESEPRYPKRIRAIVANFLQEFATETGTRGKQYVIVKTAVPQSTTDKAPIQVTMEDRLQAVARVLKENRGQELPGLMKFETVTSLFREQCQPWEMLVKSFLEDIFGAVQRAVDLALAHYADQTTKHGICRFILDPALDAMKASLDAEIDRNLRQHMHGHPITFNHYFTENIQKLRNQHQADFFKPKLAKFLQISETQSAGVYQHSSFSLDALLAALTNNTEADMNKFACTEALHYMEAYYKVALKFFIDDFSIHTIEQGLLNNLGRLFDQAKVLSLTDKQVEEIAGESKKSREERSQLSNKLAALTNSLKTLRRFDRGQHRVVSIKA